MGIIPPEYDKISITSNEEEIVVSLWDGEIVRVRVNEIHPSRVEDMAQRTAERISVALLIQKFGSFDLHRCTRVTEKIAGIDLRGNHGQ